jgi:hypothetical protein
MDKHCIKSKTNYRQALDENTIMQTSKQINNNNNNNNRTGSNCRVLAEEKMDEIGAIPENSSRKSFGERV